MCAIATFCASVHTRWGLTGLSFISRGGEVGAISKETSDPPHICLCRRHCKGEEEGKRKGKTKNPKYTERDLLNPDPYYGGLWLGSASEYLLQTDNASSSCTADWEGDGEGGMVAKVADRRVQGIGAGGGDWRGGGGSLPSHRRAKSCGGKVANLHYASVEELV